MLWWVLALRVVGLGWYVGLSIVVGVGGGVWLDKKLNTVPFFMLAGILVGSVMAFYGMYKMVKPLLNDRYDE